MLVARLSRRNILTTTRRVQSILSRKTSSSSNTTAHRPAASSTSHEPRDHPPSKPIHVSSPRHDNKAVHAEEFIPFSQIVIEDEAARAHYEHLERKFMGILGWVQKSCMQARQHAQGMVDVKLVENIRVDVPGFNNTEKRIRELGTIVRAPEDQSESELESKKEEGAAVLLILYDKKNLSSVKRAILQHNLRGVECRTTADSRSLKICVPMPSQEQRHTIYHDETGKAEHGRREIREDYKVALKKGGYARNTQEYEAFLNLEKHYTHRIDGLMHDLKQSIDGGPNRRGAGPKENSE